MDRASNLPKNLKDFYESITKRTRLNQARPLNFLQVKTAPKHRKQQTLGFIPNKYMPLNKVEDTKPSITHRNESNNCLLNASHSKSINEAFKQYTLRYSQHEGNNIPLVHLLKQQFDKQPHHNVDEEANCVGERNKCSIQSHKSSAVQEMPCVNFTEFRELRDCRALGKSKRYSLPYLSLKLALLSAKQAKGGNLGKDVKRAKEAARERTHWYEKRPRLIINKYYRKNFMVNYQNKRHSKDSMAHMLGAARGKTALSKHRCGTSRNTTPTSANEKHLCLEMWSKAALPAKINVGY